MVQHVAPEQNERLLIIADCLYLNVSQGPDRDVYEVNRKAMDLSAEPTDVCETH